MRRTRRFGAALVAAALAVGTAATVVPAAATTPTLTATLLGTYTGKRIEPSPTIFAANDLGTEVVWDRAPLHDGSLVWPSNATRYAGYDAISVDLRDVNDHDLAAGSDGTSPVVWQVGAGNAYRTVDDAALGPDVEYAIASIVDDAGQLAGTYWTADGLYGFYAASPDSPAEPVVSPTGSGKAVIEAMNADWQVISVNDGSSATAYLVNRGTGSYHALPSGQLGHKPLAADGTVVVGATVVHPDGTTVPLPGVNQYFGGADISADGRTVVGQGYLWRAGDAGAFGTPTDVGAATGIAMGDMNVTPGGTVVFGSYNSDDSIPIYAIPAGATLSGTVYGEQCTRVSCGRTGASGVTLDVSGTSTDGTTVDRQVTSGAGGVWRTNVPAGTYHVAPLPDGYDPQASDPIKVAIGQTVSGIDFTACAGVASDGTDARAAARASGGKGCVGSYTIVLSANIPQARFVDPSGDGAGANNLDGSDFPGHNYTGPGHYYLYAQHDGPANYPGCDRFNLTRRIQLTKAGDRVEWRDYFSRSSALGQVRLVVGYNRHLREAIPTVVDAAPGTMTRVFDYRIERDGKFGPVQTCSDTATVVPYAIVTEKGGEFALLVTWEFPFEAGRGSKPGEVLPQAPESVKTQVLQNLAKVPGYKLLTPAQKAIVDYNAIQLARITAKNVGWVKAVQKVSDEVDSLLKVGVGEIFEGPVSIVEGMRKLVSAAVDGYPTMDAKVVGRFTNVAYASFPKGVRTKNVGTQLVLNADTDQFPNYQLRVARNGAGLPWRQGTDTVKVNNRLAAADLPDHWLNNSDTGASQAGELRGGFRAKGVLQSDMQHVKNVFTWIGNISSSLIASTAAGSAGTVTWRVEDGRA